MATPKPTTSQFPATELLTSFGAPSVAQGSFQGPTQGFSPDPFTLAKDVVQGGFRSGGSVALTLANKPELPIDPSAPESQKRIQRILFGDEPIESLATRIAKGEQRAKELGFGKSSLPVSFGVVGALTLSDFLPGGKAAKEAAQIAISKNADEIAKILKRMGVADETLPKLSRELVDVADPKVVGKMLSEAPKGSAISLSPEANRLQDEITQLEKELKRGGPYAANTKRAILAKKDELSRLQAKEAFAMPKAPPTEPQLKVPESNKIADEAINIIKKDPESGIFGKGQVVRDANGQQIGGPRLFQRIGDALERGEIDINSLPDYVKAYGLNGEETATLFKNAATFSGKTLQALSRVEKELRSLLPDMPKVKVEPTAWQIFKSKWEAVDNFRRGLLVSQVATAMRNTISQGGRYSLEVVNDAFSGVINKLSGKEDAFGPMLEDVAAVFRRTNPENVKQIEQVLKNNPLESGRLFNTPVGDVAFGTKVTNVLNSANRFQEFMYRNLILDAKLHTLARQGKRAITELNSDEIARAVDQALEMTFSATPKRGTFFGDLYKAYRAMPFSTVLINPFPRFQMNALKFIIDHSPLGLMSLFSSKTRAAIAAGNPEAISKAITGVMMLSAATVIRNNPNIGGEKWYELRVGNKVIDMRPFAPFSTYLFIAELWSNPERLTGADFAQAALSINRIAGSGLAVVDLFQQGTPEGTIKFLKEFTGQYLGGFTVPFRSISDVVGQFRPEAAVSRDTKENPLLGPAMSNIPGLNELLPEYPSLFQKEPFKREQPLLRQATGITVKTKPYIQKEIDRLGLSTSDFIPKTGDPTINRILTKATGILLDPVNSLLQNSSRYQDMTDEQKTETLKTLISGAKSKAKGQVAKEIAEVIYDELSGVKSKEKRVEMMKSLKNKGLMTSNILDYLAPMLEANPLK